MSRRLIKSSSKSVLQSVLRMIKAYYVINQDIFSYQMSLPTPSRYLGHSGVSQVVSRNTALDSIAHTYASDVT